MSDRVFFDTNVLVYALEQHDERTPTADALAAIRSLCPPPIPVTAEMHDAALHLTALHGFHIYDALIVAAALEADCATLYTEDLQSGQVVDGRLTIRNPFTA